MIKLEKVTAIENVFGPLVAKTPDYKNQLFRQLNSSGSTVNGKYVLVTYRHFDADGEEDALIKAQQMIEEQDV